ncbi:MAG: hypothetical protein AB8W37_08350 [Arsenophonus endosymbiont of Dermacentor nuttalli]
MINFYCPHQFEMQVRQRLVAGKDLVFEHYIDSKLFPPYADSKMTTYQCTFNLNQTLTILKT